MCTATHRPNSPPGVGVVKDESVDAGCLGSEFPSHWLLERVAACGSHHHLRLAHRLLLIMVIGDAELNVLQGQIEDAELNITPCRDKQDSAELSIM